MEPITGVDSGLTKRAELALRMDIVELAKRPVKDAKFEKLHPRSTDGKFGRKTTPGKTGSFPEGTPGERPITITQDKKGGTATYEMSLANGQKIQLVDKSGQAGPFAQHWLNALANMQELYGLKPPRKFIIDKSVPKDIDGAYAWVFKGNPISHFVDVVKGKTSPFDTNTTDNEIHLNFFRMSGKSLTKFVQADAHLGRNIKDTSDKPGSYMNAAQTADAADYIIAHEFGHSYSNAKGRGSAEKALFKGSSTSEYLSTYGKTNAPEAYAESYAEWHISKGTTKNPVARAYAEHEKWLGYNDLVASGNMEEDIAFATEEVSNFSPNQVVIGDFYDGRPAILLGPEGPEPTEEEIAEAQKILDKYLPKV